ncbi:MAG: glycoside hydrolase family 16 protein [Bacteroidales bacterium]
MLGSWPAIWTLGTTKPWPNNGEIDIMEFYRVGVTPSILANAAWGSNERWKAKWDDVKIPLSGFTSADRDWVRKFHLWRMDWDENEIRLYLDDTLMNTISLAETINPDGFNPMHQPHYILLNLAIGGNGGIPRETTSVIRYEVDYVRIYQKVQEK